MPYVEGFGTWPFGEEWLWEAIATSYLPLLDVLPRPAAQRVTLSLTPVLADQLEAPGALQRCVTLPGRDPARVAPARRRGAARGRASTGWPPSWSARPPSTPRGPAGCASSPPAAACSAALAPHVSWTSAATHAILPLLATDAGALAAGADRDRLAPAALRRLGRRVLAARVRPRALARRAARGRRRPRHVRRADRRASASGDPRHLRPLAATDGPVLWPLDRADDRAGVERRRLSVARRLPRLAPPHRPPPPGLAQRRRALRPRAPRWRRPAPTRADFVARVRQRVAGGGVCVCALDTELLGHWWYEGVALAGGRARGGRAPGPGADDARRRARPATSRRRRRADLAGEQLGRGGDLRTWSGPAVAELAWRARTAELRLAALAGPAARLRALRELLALQSSDWAFLHTGGRPATTRAQRADGHHAALRAGAGRGRRRPSPRCAAWPPTWPAGDRRPGSPAERPRRLAHPDQLGRDAADDRVGRHVAGDHRAGADHRVVADRHARAGGRRRSRSTRCGRR